MADCCPVRQEDRDSISWGKDLSRLVNSIFHCFGKGSQRPIPAVRLRLYRRCRYSSRHRVGPGPKRCPHRFKTGVDSSEPFGPGPKYSDVFSLGLSGLTDDHAAIVCGIRDPDVRLGAAVRMWRHVMSRCQWGNESLEKSVTDLISDGRIPYDLASWLISALQEDTAQPYPPYHPDLAESKLSWWIRIEILESMTEPGLGC